jgi:predicted nucleic acid-binding protein
VNVLVDTNVWLDILQDREPHYVSSARTVSVLERPEYEAHLGATTLTTLFYLQQRASNTDAARDQVRRWLDRFRVAPVEGRVLRSAVELEVIDDFEDAVLREAAHRAGLDAIVTRNPDDFESDPPRIYTPDEFLAAVIE